MISIPALGLSKKVTERAARVFRECGFQTEKDLSRDKFEAWLGKLSSEATRTSYRSAMSSVGARMVSAGLLRRNPFSNKDRQLAGAKAAVPLPGDLDSLADRFVTATGKDRQKIRTAIRKTGITSASGALTASLTPLDKPQRLSFQAFQRWLVEAKIVTPKVTEFDILLTQCQQTWHYVIKSPSPREAFLQLVKENPTVAASRSPIHLFVRSGDIEFHLTAKSLHDASKRAEEVHLHFVEPKRLKKPEEGFLYWPFDVPRQA